MLRSVRYCHAAKMVRNGLMVSAFTLIFAVSASAQDGLRRVVSASWVNSSATTSMNSSAAASRCSKGEITRC